MSYRGAAIFTVGVCTLALALLLPVGSIIYPFVHGNYTIAYGSIIMFSVGLTASLVVIKWGSDILQISFERGVSFACFISIIFSIIILTKSEVTPLTIQDTLNAIIGILLLSKTRILSNLRY